MYIAALADRRRVRLRRHRHSVSAGTQGHGARLRSGRRSAQQQRPPARLSDSTGKELYAGGPLPHFNEVDECAGLDALVTNRCWTALGLDPSTTLHDVRWGEHYKAMAHRTSTISCGCCRSPAPRPPNHFVDGYRGASSDRQPPMYFPLGGGTLKGIGSPGENRLEPRLRRRQQPARRHRPWHGRRACPRKKPNAAGARPPASGPWSAPHSMASRATPSWRAIAPITCQHRLRTGRKGCRTGARRQGGDVPHPRGTRASLRRRQLQLNYRGENE